jgi:hypothetical protein
VHLYLWQLTLIIFVVGLFFAWLSWVRGRPAKAPLATPAPDASPGPEAGPREEKKR